MKLSKEDLAAIFDDASYFNRRNEQSFDARKALEDGTLEIDGYKRISEELDIDFSHPCKFPRHMKKFNDNFENSVSEL